MYRIDLETLTDLYDMEDALTRGVQEGGVIFSLDGRCSSPIKIDSDWVFAKENSRGERLLYMIGEHDYCGGCASAVVQAIILDCLYAHIMTSSGPIRDIIRCTAYPTRQGYCDGCTPEECEE